MSMTVLVIERGSGLIGRICASFLENTPVVHRTYTGCTLKMGGKNIWEVGRLGIGSKE